MSTLWAIKMKRYKRWTKQEIDFIAENYNKIKDQELAKLLCKDERPVTVDMIRRQRRNLKIRKKRGRPNGIKGNSENSQKLEKDTE